VRFERKPALQEVACSGVDGRHPLLGGQHFGAGGLRHLDLRLPASVRLTRRHRVQNGWHLQVSFP